MAEEIARIGIYGDIHLCSKNYGGHKDYAKESLLYFSKITEITKRRNLTHLIGLGDFSFGRFHSLEYRKAVEDELEAQKSITNGNRYEIFGNHDSATYGMTERDYYVEKGLMKESENLKIGKLNLSMLDYGTLEKAKLNISDKEDEFNFVLAHDFFKFVKTSLPNFGKAIELDTVEKLYGADCIVCGHVHKVMSFSGFITKGEMAHECKVNYLGCMSRPAYKEGNMDEIGQVMVVIVKDDGTVDVEIETVALLDLEESFNLEVKAREVEIKAQKDNRVNISDIVKQLDAHDRNVGNAEDIINGLKDIDSKYKDKAIELLKNALA
jgi:predicted phosphodiesterase